MSARIVTRRTGPGESFDTLTPDGFDVYAITASGQEVLITVKGEQIHLFYPGRILVPVPTGGPSSLTAVPIPDSSRDLLKGLGLPLLFDVPLAADEDPEFDNDPDSRNGF